jgi:hypothetical protein
MKMVNATVDQVRNEKQKEVPALKNELSMAKERKQIKRWSK